MSADQLRGYVSRLARIGQAQALTWFEDNAPTAEQIVEQLPEILDVYTEEAALLAVNLYYEADPASRFRPVKADLVPKERFADLAAWVFEGPQSPESRLTAAVHSAVFDAARDTISGSARGEGVAYVRDEEAGACDECMGRATGVAKDRNSSVDDVVWDRHTRCEFLFIPVRRGLYEPPARVKEWQSRISAGNTSSR